MFTFSKSTLNLVENISILFSASLIASGPNLVPGLKECVESNGTPYYGRDFAFFVWTCDQWISIHVKIKVTHFTRWAVGIT